MVHNPMRQFHGLTAGGDWLKPTYRERYGVSSVSRPNGFAAIERYSRDSDGVIVKVYHLGQTPSLKVHLRDEEGINRDQSVSEVQ